MIEKSHILSEIKRTAENNDGKPLGMGQFLKETGIKKTDWAGRHWARWSDALTEAGFSPNSFDTAYSDSYLLEKFTSLIKKLGHYPVDNELKMEARQNSEFPSSVPFRRLGRKHEIAAKIIESYQDKPGYKDVIDICLPICDKTVDVPIESVELSNTYGFVYLAKSGKYHKIGLSNSPGRREYEFKLQLPEKCEIVHEIRTDDPVGIERYWHERFKESRKNGEWFVLTAKQVSDFKRRKFM